MSRHRIVRSMNYSDEYDGYDDVYGHSVEDDYSMSPSDAAFMYDRDSRQPAQFSAFLTTEEDIQEEEDEETSAGGGGGGRKDSFVKPPLSDLDEARLRSCRDEVQSVVGDSLPDATLDETILRCDFDVARTLDALLQSPPTKTVTKSVVAKPAANLESPVSKTKSAAKLDGKDDFNIMSSDCDRNLKKVAKRMSTAERIAASVAPLKPVHVESKEKTFSNREKSVNLENNEKPVNRIMVSTTRASGFSSLKALKMKHKQTSANDANKSRGSVEERPVEKIVECEASSRESGNRDKVGEERIGNVSTVNNNSENSSEESGNKDLVEEKKVENVFKLESLVNSSETSSRESENKDMIEDKKVDIVCKLESTLTNSEVKSVDSSKLPSSESKPRSVCTPGRTSSLAALAKRCRNPSERRSFSEQKPVLSNSEQNPVLSNSEQNPVLSNSSVSDQIASDYLPLKFEKLTVDETDSSSKPVTKNNFVIDLMAALRSPSDDEKISTLDESQPEPSSNNVQSNLLEDVRANIFTEFVMVKNEFQKLSCSPFGEIICKTFACDCREFVCAPEVIDSTVERFAFDVLSPDDEIRKFRKNW